MFHKAHHGSDETAAIQGLLSDLQTRLRRLNGNLRQEVAGASGEAGDYLNDLIGRLSDQVRVVAGETGHSVGHRAAKLSTEARKRIEEGVEHRPMMALAFAAGIGFLLGMASRRSG